MPDEKYQNFHQVNNSNPDIFGTYLIYWNIWNYESSKNQRWNDHHVFRSGNSAKTIENNFR